MADDPRLAGERIGSWENTIEVDYEHDAAVDAASGAGHDCDFVLHEHLHTPLVERLARSRSALSIFSSRSGDGVRIKIVDVGILKKVYD